MICNKCKTHLNFDNFYRSTLCKKCHREYQNEYREKNREKYNCYLKDYQYWNRWLNGGEDNWLLGGRHYE